MKRTLAMLAATGALFAAGVATASPAAAADGQPCGPRVDRPGPSTELVQYCPVIKGGVPVHQNINQSSPIVGYLNQGGSANWFFGQCVGGTAHRGPYENYWWALTVADNGQKGYVSEVWFTGGGNNEPDGALHTSSQYCPAPTGP